VVVAPLARSYPISSPTHAGAMASASCRVSPSALPTNTAQILALPCLHQSFFALNFEKPNNQ
jgi:hypothetical protein